MPQDVGIARAGERVEDASVAQSDDGIAGYRPHEAATIDELAVGHVLIVVALVGRS